MNMLACAAAVEHRTLPSPVISREEEKIDPALMRDVMGEREGDPYRVGPGDHLLIAVYNHPELSLATASGTTSGAVPGYLVDLDGTIQVPLMGSAKVAGKSLEELRVHMQKEFSVYVRDPKVTVQILSYGNIRYYLLGQFTDPGMKIASRPMRLLETLALGGSVKMEAASLRGSYIVRHGKKLPVSFMRLLRQGDMEQNIRMRPGDTIVVPDNMIEQAFVFGGAPGTAARGGAVPFRNGRLNLLQALAQAGYGFRERAQGKLGHTMIIRGEGDRGELFIVDAKAIINGEAAPFELVPGDVVYVPPRAFTRWNQALEQLLPTLQTIGGILNPFVQVMYLRDSIRQNGGLTN